MEVLAHEIYTATETRSLLKISKSTFLRLIKKGSLSASKIGGQYRILGEEILALFNPKIQKSALGVYRAVRNGVRRIKEC